MTDRQPVVAVPAEKMRDLPERVVVGANGAYWRDYGTHYSMCPVSDDNDPVVPVAVYVRAPELAGALGRLDAPMDWDRDDPAERLDRFVNEVRAIVSERWWTDGVMVNAGPPGDEGFIGDAATESDAQRIVDAHNNDPTKDAG